MKIELKAGGVYRTRDGRKVEIWNKFDDTDLCWLGVQYHEYHVVSRWYAANGRYSCEEDIGDDIISEWHDLPEGFTPWFGGEFIGTGKKMEVIQDDGLRAILKPAPSGSVYTGYDNIIGYRVVEEKQNPEPVDTSDWWEVIVLSYSDRNCVEPSKAAARIYAQDLILGGYKNIYIRPFNGGNMERIK